jgi:DNA (cytosine-5)-methyltransferase 1
MSNTNIHKPTAMSLFSGLGGDSLGLKNAGCEVIAFNELNNIFCESHEANFPNCKRIHENNTNDITKVSDETFGDYKGKIDILFAGFPCQGFSQAGKKMVNDPRNTLFREFLRVASITEPYMVIGENVKGLCSRKTAEGELYIDIIVNEFEKLGYEMIYKIMKANKYGVPQKRERLILIGVKPENPYGWKPVFPEEISGVPNLINIIRYDMSNSIMVDEKLFENIPHECILTKMEDTNEYTKSNEPHPYLARLYNADETLRTYNEKTHDNLLSFGKRDSPIHGEIIDIRCHAKTIICSYDHQPRFFVPLKNASGCFLRCILPDELKQIQGFPENYIVKGNWKNQVVQIGNAVPPPLIEIIVENIIR